MVNSFRAPTGKSESGPSDSSSTYGALVPGLVYTSVLQPPSGYELAGKPGTRGASIRKARLVPTHTSVSASKPNL